MCSMIFLTEEEFELYKKIEETKEMIEYLKNELGSLEEDFKNKVFKEYHIYLNNSNYIVNNKVLHIITKGGK